MNNNQPIDLSKLYPVQSKGKSYERSECNPLFVRLYEKADFPEALNFYGGIYYSDEASIYPDGTTDDTPAKRPKRFALVGV